MSNPPYTLDVAQIDWNDSNNPKSCLYEDIYFSTLNGLSETDYVFLQHNQLKERFKQLRADISGTFTIAETGFGTGLNFLATWQLWTENAPKSWTLVFISVEKHPLLKADLTRSLTAWPELSAFSQQLLHHYPPLIPGLHPLHFAPGTVQLHLIFQEAVEGLQQCLDTDHPVFAHHLGVKVDAWFLDGFAPAKNPTMWQAPLFNIMGQLSRPGTTFATFTAAGIVRRGLADQGFIIKKAPGFGRKREMIYGEFSGPANRLTPSSKKPRKGVRAPWQAITKQQRPEHVAVIGGGLAGTTTAYALAKRGISVTLIERHPQLAQEASGNAQGMLYTKLSPQEGLLNQFTLGTFLYAQRFYQGLLEQGLLTDLDIQLCGLLQLACNEKEHKLLNQLKPVFANHPQLVKFMDAKEASNLAGIEIDHPGYWFPHSGWIAPISLCQTLSQHPLIDVRTHCEALTLAENDTNPEDNTNHWRILDPQGKTILTTSTIVIANSHDAVHFKQSQTLPLKVVRGQITELSAQSLSTTPQTVICHEGYLTPAIDHVIRFGATFQNNTRDKSLHSADHRSNLQSLYRSIPSLFPEGIDHLAKQTLNGRANLRCTSPDYMPLVGPLPHQEQFLSDYASLGKDATLDIEISGSYLPGLFVNIAHGARGLTSSPLCSELLAALICHEPRPLNRNQVTALNPARFLIRDIVRGLIHTQHEKQA